MRATGTAPLLAAKRPLAQLAQSNSTPVLDDAARGSVPGCRSGDACVGSGSAANGWERLFLGAMPSSICAPGHRSTVRTSLSSPALARWPLRRPDKGPERSRSPESPHALRAKENASGSGNLPRALPQSKLLECLRDSPGILKERLPEPCELPKSRPSPRRPPVKLIRFASRDPSPAGRSPSQDSSRSPSRSPSTGRARTLSGSLRDAIGPQVLKQLFHRSLGNDELEEIVTQQLFASLPRDNVVELSVQPVDNVSSQDRFYRCLQDDGASWPRVQVAWHLAGSREASEAIISEGLRCEEAHCKTGRYGRGGYVAVTAAKANAYADDSSGDGMRYLFLLLVLPEKDVLQGERNTRPERTAADLPSHPTEYCFVDSARVHTVCLIRYRWLRTRARQAWRPQCPGQAFQPARSASPSR